MSQVHGSKTNTVFNSRIPDPLTPFFLCAFATLREIILSARDHLDLDLGVQRQTGHGHGRAGRIITLDYTGIDPVHGVKTIDLNGVSRTCAYDPNGNMVTSPDFTNATNPLNRAITYDADNMPTRIVHANGATVDFVYDGVGKRTKKIVASGKTVLYLGDHFEVENGVNIKYIFGGNLRLAQIKGSLTSYFHKDHLGSTAAVTDEAGVKVESTTYEPFGSTRTQEGTVVSNYKFTDQELDNETNLYNYDARLYDPVLGMFVTPDSIVPGMFDPQSLNRYSYCRNNPLIYVDPSGHSFGERPNGKADRINDKPNSDDGTTPRDSWGGVLAPPTPPKGPLPVHKTEEGDVVLSGYYPGHVFIGKNSKVTIKDWVVVEGVIGNNGTVLIGGDVTTGNGIVNLGNITTSGNQTINGPISNSGNMSTQGKTTINGDVDNTGNFTANGQTIIDGTFTNYQDGHYSFNGVHNISGGIDDHNSTIDEDIDKAVNRIEIIKAIGEVVKFVKNLLF